MIVIAPVDISAFAGDLAFGADVFLEESEVVIDSVF